VEQVNELCSILAKFFDWHKSHLTCLGQMVQALLVVRTINLTQLAGAFKSKAKEESSCRRMRRFFAEVAIDTSLIVLLILRLFPLGDKYKLIMDRTNWKWGKTSINILVLSIAYRGIGIPIFWAVLNLEGNSCSQDRIDLLKRVLKHLGVEKIEVLLADREFIGTEWFRFLVDHGIPFAIRTRQNSLVTIEGRLTLRAGRLRRQLAQKKVVNYAVQLWGLPLYVSIERRKGAQEQMIVVSNIKFEDPLGLYRRRWEIETLFGCLKTRGFRMEDTHITDPDRVEKVMFVLAIAFCWAYRIGDIQDQEKPIEVKAHGRRAKSLFRAGLDLIRRAIFWGWLGKKFRQILSCFTSSKSRTCAS